MKQEAPSKNIVERIRRVLALTNSSNEHEAAVAAVMAERLLHKYNLDIAQVIKADTEGLDITVGEKRYDLPWAPSKWKYHLAFAIADVNFCKIVYWNSKYLHAAKFIGREHNVEASVEILDWIIRQILKLADDDKIINKRSWKYRQSYVFGCFITVRNRLNDEFSRMQAESNDGTSLILINDVAVEKFYNKKHPRVRSSSLGCGVRSLSGSGYDSGRAAGETVNIGRKPEQVSHRELLKMIDQSTKTIRETPDETCELCTQMFDGECRAYSLPHSDEEIQSRTGKYGMECDPHNIKEIRYKRYGVKYRTPKGEFDR